MSSTSNSEDVIRKQLIEADLVECMVALPPQLFYSTGIPVCLWLLNRDKSEGGPRGWRDRRGEILFIDARNLGSMVTRVHRELSDADIASVAETYHSWRGEAGSSDYADRPGFACSASRAEVEERGFVLTPGRYVGSEGREVAADLDAQVQKSLADLLEHLRVADGLSADLRSRFGE